MSDAKNLLKCIYPDTYVVTDHIVSVGSRVDGCTTIVDTNGKEYIVNKNINYVLGFLIGVEECELF